MRSEISIAILSYNHPQLSARTAQSALLQNKPVILVHNGSESKNVAELTEKFPEVQHVVIEKNRGYSGGANEALEAGFKKSNWVLFLTNDTWIETPLDTLDLPSNLKPGIYCPLTFMRSTQNIDSIGGWFDPSTGKLLHNKTEEGWDQGKYSKYVPGSAYLIHRDVFEKTGRFDESLGTYWEDVDYSMRVKAQGFEIGLLPGLIIRHGVGKTCRKDSHYTLFLYHRNRRIVSMRYARWDQKPKLLFILIKDLISAACRLMASRRFTELPVLLGLHKR